VTPNKYIIESKSIKIYWLGRQRRVWFSGGSRGGSLGSDEPPPLLRPGVVVENARTAWLYQSSNRNKL